jgi:transposase
MDVTNLLPPDGGLTARSLVIGPDSIQIDAETTGHSAECPRCGVTTDRVHGRYVRIVDDLPWLGRRVCIRVQVRRFRCHNPACPQQTFTERLPAVAAHAQATRSLAEAQRSIGFALGGEPGSRLSRRLAMPTSPDTLLRRVRTAGSEVGPTPRVLGVDDFAFRRASTYGTILVDLERRRAVELLPDREAATLARWLCEHPGIEVISRDRASAYAQAAREASPDAVQVADRWHLLANLRDALERFLQRRSATIRELLRDAAPEKVSVPANRPQTAQSVGSVPDSRAGTSEQRVARFQKVRSLHEDGMSLRSIARTLGLHYQTVERYVRSDACPDWQPGRDRPSILDQHTGFIRERLVAGCQNASQIHRELQGLGCRCGKTIVKDTIRRLRADEARPSVPDADVVRRERPAFVSFRRLAVAAVRRADGRSPDEQELLGRLATDTAGIGEALGLAEGFAALIRGRRPAGLGAWHLRAEQSAVSEMRSFAGRLRQDEAAVRAGMELDWSNGPTEGHVNRLKLVKRSMYGRAGFDLLRARVLSAR